MSDNTSTPTGVLLRQLRAKNANGAANHILEGYVDVVAAHIDGALPNGTDQQKIEKLIETETSRVDWFRPHVLKPAGLENLSPSEKLDWLYTKKLPYPKPTPRPRK